MLTGKRNITKKASKVVMPSRMPSFERISGLNNHLFEIAGEEYEFIEGVYFRKVKTLGVMESFGELAL